MMTMDFDISQSMGGSQFDIDSPTVEISGSAEVTGISLAGNYEISYTYDDVRVLDPGQRSRLSLEAPLQCRPVHHLGAHDLERNLPLETLVARSKDLPHPARAEELDHLVAPRNAGSDA